MTTGFDSAYTLDVDGAHAVFAALARLYGTDSGASGSARLEAAGSVAPASALWRAQQSAEREAARMLLDRLPFGIVVIDSERRRLLANAAGGRMLAEAVLIRIEDDRVTPAVDVDAPVLRALLERASTRGAWPSEGIAVPLRRADGGHPVRVLALVLDAGDAAGRGLVLLLPDEGRENAMRRLMTSLFGLTPAEARLAMLMAAGLSLAEAASERGITINTARSHWQTVMWKVGGGADAPLLALLRSALALPLASVPSQ